MTVASLLGKLLFIYDIYRDGIVLYNYVIVVDFSFGEGNS